MDAIFRSLFDCRDTADNRRDAPIHEREFAQILSSLFAGKRLDRAAFFARDFDFSRCLLLSKPGVCELPDRLGRGRQRDSGRSTGRDSDEQNDVRALVMEKAGTRFADLQFVMSNDQNHGGPRRIYDLHIRLFAPESPYQIVYEDDDIVALALKRGESQQ